MKNLRFILGGICLAVLLACSCASGGIDAATAILGGSSKAPVFLYGKAVSETEIEFEFSHDVSVTSLSFSPEIMVDDVENGSTVRVTFSGGPGPGERLSADILAVDEKGNTINVLITLRTRNSRIPRLLINELRTDYSSPSRGEFIELLTQEAGNMGALRVFVASNNRSPLLYEFPSIEVAKGEYITLHLRTLDAGTRDELGNNLAESGGSQSSPTGRDLWIPGSTKLLRRTDAVYLLDQDDNVVDGVLLSENADPWWNRDYFAEAAELLFRAGVWQCAEGKIAGPADAIRTSGTTATRTINRDETLADRTGGATGWYITATSGASPGKPNDPRRHN